jgi:hypothetical protein
MRIPPGDASEETWPEERRARLRDEIVASLSRFYSPTLHFLFPVTAGVVGIVACLAQLRAPTALELLTIPLTLVLANASEWRLHKSLLHKRTPPFHALYDRHTPGHHMVFVTSDMAIRSKKELALVLFPWWAILVLAAVVTPLGFAVSRATTANVGWAFIATCLFYLVAYECLHTTYHLPKSSVVWRLPLVATLARLHTNHHDPRWMQRYNFNVNIPLWDVVRGTLRSRDDDDAHAEQVRGDRPSASASSLPQSRSA